MFRHPPNEFIFVYELGKVLDSTSILNAKIENSGNQVYDYRPWTILELFSKILHSTPHENRILLQSILLTNLLLVFRRSQSSAKCIVRLDRPVILSSTEKHWFQFSLD